MNIVEEHITELHATGCFTLKELEDLRVRFIKVYEDGFWEGREFSKNEDLFLAYGKKEDL